MPNGHPDWVKKELPKLETFFGKIADVLESFGKEYNLMIDKYYHQFPSWDFRFRHPKGGVGQIEVSKCEDEYVKISPVWWLDDYDKYTRYFKKSEGKKYMINNKSDLKEVLVDIFRIIISWRREDLAGKPDPVLKRMWHGQWTKEEFEKLDEGYPIPKID